MRWTQFRDAIGRLSVRRKVTLELWERLITPVFADLGTPRAVERAIGTMFFGSHDWCAAGAVDEARAQAELARCIRAIEFWSNSDQKKEGVTMQRDVRTVETGRERIERALRVASEINMPDALKAKFIGGVTANVELEERQARLTEILATL